MRAVDVVASLAPIAGACFGALAAVQHRLIRHYESRAAVGPDSATAPPLARLAPTRWWKSRLMAQQVLRALPDGREWLDEARWASYRRERRRRAFVVVSSLLVLLLVLLLVGAWLTARR